MHHRRHASVNKRDSLLGSLGQAVGGLLDTVVYGPSSTNPSAPAATPASSNGNGKGNGGQGSGSGSGNGNGGGNGNGNGGGNGNGNGGGSSGGGNNGGSGSGGGGSGGSGGGNGGGGLPGPGTPSTVGNGSTPMPPVQVGNNPGPPGPNPSSGSSAHPSTSLSGLPAAATGSSSGQLSSGSSSPANAAGYPSGVSGAVGTSGNSFGSGQSGLASASNSGITGSGSTLSPTLNAEAGTTHSGLSSGAITGIVVFSLLLLLTLILMVLRRRVISRRSQRLRQWWFNNSGTSGGFSFVGVGSHPSQDSTGPGAGNRASARSSFATHFDQGLLFRMESPTAQLGAPEFPPMAEVRDRNSILIATGGQAARRESFLSMMSNSNDPDAQYLIVPTEHNSIDPCATSPMSVRPFSPSETFSFPKPPAPLLSPTLSPRQAVDSSISSTATLVQLHSPPAVFSHESTSPVTCSPGTILAMATPAPAAHAINPFDDPVHTPVFAHIEKICRPFIPTLEDELLVSPDDNVRILQVFDDGWAMVERVGLGTSTQSNQQRRGLIPVDCFREAGQPLPSFLAQKSLSDYVPHGTHEMKMV